MPPASVYTMTVDAEDAPDEAEEVMVSFASGVACALDGRAIAGPALLSELNQHIEQFVVVSQIKVAGDHEIACHPVVLAKKGVAEGFARGAVRAVAQMAEQ